MGYYIETGQPKNKAAVLIEELDAREISQGDVIAAIRGNLGAVICVVDNGPFEAAAYCHSLDEFENFTHPSDVRPKTWLLIEDVDTVKRLTGSNK
jgi:hypothetical protein